MLGDTGGQRNKGGGPREEVSEGERQIFRLLCEQH